MSPHELIALLRVANSAAKAREAQRRYFRSRSKADLLAAKSAESNLDHDLSLLDAVRRAEKGEKEAADV